MTTYFCQLTRKLTLDLDYYSSLFSEWALLNYLKKQSADEIRRKIDEEMQPFSRYKLRAQQKDVNNVTRQTSCQHVRQAC